MTISKVALLGSKIQYLTADIQHSLDNNASKANSQDELLDAIDELHAELIGPMKWPGSFLAPPDFSAMQVAFQRGIFQHVPLSEEKANGNLQNGTVPNGAISNGAVSSGLIKKEPTASSISTKELALKAKMDEDLLVRIMRLLAANNIFREIDEKVFAHTPLSAGMADELVSAHLGGLLYDVYKASTSLADMVEGGFPSAWEARFGMPLYEYFEKGLSPDRERLAKSMLADSKKELADLSNSFPWERFKKVVDIGGGAGHLAAYLAEQHPHLQAVSQDLPGVIADAIARLPSLPPSYSLVEFQCHNYFSPNPRSDADAFILRRCLHNNDDANCIKMIRAVVPGLEKGGEGARLLINEKLVPKWNEGGARHRTKRLRQEDVTMMISVGGKERTVGEFEILAREADGRFELDGVYPGLDFFAVVAFKLAPAALEEPTTTTNMAEQLPAIPLAS